MAIEKEWIAIDDNEEIVERAQTKGDLLGKIDKELCPTCGCITYHEYEIVAVPKAHTSIFL